MKSIFKLTVSIVVFSLVVFPVAFHITSCTKDRESVSPVDTTDPPQVVDTVSFKNNIQPIFRDKCTLCHNLDDDSGTGLNLSDVTSYKHLVNVTSFGYSPALRVKPFDADSSVLWNKVAGTGVYGAQMPLMGPLLRASEIDKIKNWIKQGAKDN